jgi:hypothetical protein
MRLEGWPNTTAFIVAVLRDALALRAKAPQDEGRKDPHALRLTIS